MAQGIFREAVDPADAATLLLGIIQSLVLRTLPLALVGFGILAFIVARNPPPERNELAERATAVRVTVAQSQAVAPLLTGYGVVSPARTFEAIAEVGGTAEYVNPSLEKGAIMPAGDILLRLSTADFNLAIARHAPTSARRRSASQNSRCPKKI